MTIMTPLLASQIRSLSPTSFWRWAAAPKTPSRTCSSPTIGKKIHAQISKTASFTQTKT
jgi:hypothetical protein